VAAGGGILVANEQFTADWIVREVIPRVTDPAVLDRMSRAAELSGARDADRVLAQNVLDIVAAEHRR
jgi:UDP-N-acetylglucosamine--N-acetylmuramyl-(pentapeptide) pyrophosphoryl-undecaprenol N-acetylglucosamine transferase